MAKATKTIFVGHKPGTFKAYYGLVNGETGWYVAFLGDDGEISHPAGEQIYAHRQGAYRRAKQLNELLHSSEAHTAGEEAGREHGWQWNWNNPEHREWLQNHPGHGEANKADPTIASYEKRKEVAIEKAKAQGFTSPQEIHAYVVGYTAAYVDAILEH